MDKPVKKRRKNTPMMEAWRRLKKNRWALVSLYIILGIFLMAIFAPLLGPYDYAQQNYGETLQSPNWAHPFGTDNFGRDMLSRVIYGSRYSVLIGFGCVGISAIVGIVLGLISAYFPKLDNFLMRVMDVIIGMPAMTLLMCIIAALGISLTNLIIALCVTSIPTFARVVRAQAMTIKNQEFIEGAIAIGANHWRILLRHILPNSIAPVIVTFTLEVGTVILLSAGLSFIGMGVQAPTPEWGLLISTGRQYLRTNWYLSIIPGLALVLMIFVLNYLGDGVRDAMDPRLKK